MKFACACGFESDSPQDFWTHVTEGRKQGTETHGRVIEAKASQVSPKAEVKAKQEPRQRTVSSFNFNNKWLVIGLALIGWLASLGLGNMWLTNSNIALGLFVVILFFGCPIVIWRTAKSNGFSRRQRSSTRVVRPADMQTPGTTAVVATEVNAKSRGVKNLAVSVEGEVNAFNVYVRHGNPNLGENQIVPVLAEWCHMDEDKLLGQPKMLLNDKKWYHMHILGPEPNTTRAFTLTDEAYVNPGFMSRYLDAPCQRSYVDFVRETMAKWVGPGMLALMDGVLLLVIYLRLSGG